MSAPAFQQPATRGGWFLDHDGVWSTDCHYDDSQPYRFDLDQDLDDDEYIQSVSWQSWGPTLTAAASAKQVKGTMTFTGAPSNAESFVLNDTAFDCLTTPLDSDDFAPGSDELDAAANVAAVINGGSEADLFSAVDNGDGTVTVLGGYGTGDNDTVFTSALSNCTVDGGGTLGGTQAGTTVGGIDGKSHSVTVTGAGDAEVTVTTNNRRLVKRFRWKAVDRARDGYR